MSDPIQVVKAMMAERGLTNVDLYPVFGSKSRTSEVLLYRRPLQVKHIRALRDKFGLSADDLIAAYPTSRITIDTRSPPLSRHHPERKSNAE